MQGSITLQEALELMLEEQKQQATMASHILSLAIAICIGSITLGLDAWVGGIISLMMMGVVWLRYWLTKYRMKKDYFGYTESEAREIIEWAMRKQTET
ncbi:hypothetical protein [Neptuniibacter sp. QD37_11]|uniref:hypothetical protein n=1 Tax=Neptuniibacter sp. QD37_11 TaxID=3398209 RepID=UPI0039F5541E